MNFKLSIEGKIIVPVLVSIPSLFSSPAEILEIPISAQLKVQTDTSFNSPFKIKLSMPAHYFSPDRVNNPAIQKDSIYDGLRYLEIIGNINGLNSSDRNLIKFTGTVLVGDIVPAEIKIIETIWNDTLFVNDYDNGELNIEDCSLDLRQIKLFTPTKMNFSPNPIENENLNVRVFSEEIGEFELFLFNNEGGKFHLTKWTRDEISQTEFSFNFHLNNYPSGFYNLVLKSPWYSVVEKIRLVR
jgi:hypothetical protein